MEQVRSTYSRSENDVQDRALHVYVLLGGGTPLFEGLGVEQRQLERSRVLEGEGGVTHLRFRVHSVGG